MKSRKDIANWLWNFILIRIEHLKLLKLLRRFLKLLLVSVILRNANSTMSMAQKRTSNKGIDNSITKMNSILMIFSECSLVVVSLKLTSITHEDIKFIGEGISTTNAKTNPDRELNKVGLLVSSTCHLSSLWSCCLCFLLWSLGLLVLSISGHRGRQHNSQSRWLPTDSSIPTSYPNQLSMTSPKTPIRSKR